MWTRNGARVVEIAGGSNASALPELTFDRGLIGTSDMTEALANVSVAVLAVPSHAIADTARSALAVSSAVRFVSVAKGIDPSSLKTHSQIVAKESPGSPFCALTGPSFAREVIAGHPTALVAASADPVFAQEVQTLFSGPRLRVYESGDVLGVELSGALKNVIAIASGMVEGMKCGENTRAALITRGLAEIGRLVAAMGGRADTVTGLAGLGDLVLTCSSRQSRNHEFGRLVAQGQEAAAALSSLGTVEGLRTTSAACLLGEKFGVETPIAREVRGVLVLGVPPREAVEGLMLRRLKREVH